jgi:hypothetical protein
VTGGPKDIDGNCGQGVSWTIDRWRRDGLAGGNAHLDGGDTTIASGTVHNGDVQSFAGRTAGGSLDAVRVTPGTMLFLTIDAKNGDMDCDSTAVSMSVTKLATAPAQLRVYGTDFSGSFSSSSATWSTTGTTTSPNGTSAYLGPLSTDPAPSSATLTLKNLPPNTGLLVSWRIHVINTMDGDCTVPDAWSLTVGGTSNVAWQTSYSNPDWGCAAYPDAQSFDGDRFYAGYDAVASSSLGEASPGAGELDTTYQRSLLLPHDGSTATITFAGIGLQSPEDESWGLDDVTVDAVTVPSDPRQPPGAAICTFPSGRTKGESTPLTIIGKNLGGLTSAGWYAGTKAKTSTDVTTLTSGTKYKVYGPSKGDLVSDVTLRFANGDTALTHCTDTEHATPYLTSVSLLPDQPRYALLRGFNFRADSRGLTSITFGGAKADLATAEYGGVAGGCSRSTCVAVKVPAAPTNRRLVHVEVANAWGPSSAWVGDLFDYPHVDSLAIVKHGDGTYWLQVRGRQLQYATRSYFRVRHPDNSLSAIFGQVSKPQVYGDGTQSIDTLVPALGAGDKLQSIRVGLQTPVGDTDSIGSDCTTPTVDCLEFQPGRPDPQGVGLRTASGKALKLGRLTDPGSGSVLTGAPRSASVHATGSGFDSGQDVRLYFVSKGQAGASPASYDLDQCPAGECAFIRLLPTQYTDSQLTVPVPQTAPLGPDYVYIRTATGQRIMGGSSPAAFEVQENPDDIIGFVATDGTILPPSELQPRGDRAAAVGKLLAAAGADKANFVNYGHDIEFGLTRDGRVIASGGGNVIASGGGNVIASGGGNRTATVEKVTVATYQFVATPEAQTAGSLVGTSSGVHLFRDGSDLGVIRGVTSPSAGSFSLRKVDTTPHWAFSTSAPSTTTARRSGVFDFLSLFCGLLGQAGGNVISSGGGNVIASGGGNGIASGGGHCNNPVAFGLLSALAQNLIGWAGGNVIASGGGNVISSGGGNMIAPGGAYFVTEASMAVKTNAMSSKQFEDFKVKMTQ